MDARKCDRCGKKSTRHKCDSGREGEKRKNDL